MSPQSQAATLERLLAQEGWMRHLARALVADAATADDLAQEAWSRILARPPVSVESPRAWLASVLRRIAGERLREERARTRRERAVATRREEAHEDPALDGRVEAAQRARQHLARALLSLSEPGRSAVVLRYFVGRSAAQIARETGVPESTVRNRLRRSLAELREILDRESGGDRSRWHAALLVVAGSDPAPAARSPFPAAEVLLMALKTKLLIPVVVLLLGALPFVLHRITTPPPAPVLPGEIALHEPARVQAPLESEPGRAPAQAPASDAASTTPAPVAAGATLPPAPPLPPGWVEVRVVRAAAHVGQADIPVTGGRVWLGLSDVFLPQELEADPALTRVAALDASGWATFRDIPPGPHPIGVQLGAAPPVQALAVVRHDQGERIVVRLGASGLNGTVHDPAGPIVAGARVQISREKPFEERVHVVTWTGADGRYEALHLPPGAYRVGVDLSGTQDASGGEYATTVEVPAATVLELDFGRPAGLPLWRGHVRTASGESAAGQTLWGRGGQIHLERTDKWSYSHHPWGEDGAFAIRVEPGTYEVALSLPGRDERHVVIAELRVDPRAREWQPALERDLVLPGATLTGFVAEGRWIALGTAPGVAPLVFMQRPPDGKYRIDGIPAGTWWLSAGDLAVELVVLASDRVVNVDLR